MLTTLSVGALYLGYATLAAYARPTSAISFEANQICEVASGIMRDREGSESLFGQKAVAMSALRSAVAAVSPDEEQEVVDPQALLTAEQLVLALPDDLPTPEFGIDPDGAISFDWIQSRTRMFTVNVSDSERLAYAWLNGSDRGHGVDRFRGPLVSAVLVSVLRSIVANDVPAFRVG
jgi:hypothetical protein